MSGTETGDAGDDYGGLLGAFPYAVRHSDSWLFRAYAVLGGLLSLLLSLFFLISFVLAVAGSVGLAAGGTSSFVRAFVVFVGFLVVAPLFAPVLFVARHHRLVGNDPGYDRALGAAGVGYALALYLGAIVSVPAEFQTPATGPVAPVVEFLYGLPSLAGVVPPAVAALVVYLVHRAMR
ncbi:hypothetical protein [Halorarius halobius]|uniref:hypothetical protein n=1 Tax=Halorarius halobius TaxID=2962671 RepID=UPI0020CDC37E|nr:hypothetical protein [Halorarius halobius]